MKKTFKLIRLPSENPGSLFTHMKKLIFSPGAKQNKAPETNPQILCIVSKDEVSGLRFIIDNREGMNGFIHEVSNNYPYCLNIIASTDKEMTPNSWISESFVKAYVKAFGEGINISEVDLEIDDDPNIHGYSEFGGIHVKTREDKSVIIHPSKTYSRSDVEKKIFDFNKWRKDAGKLGQNEPALIAKWIDENL